MNITAFNCTVPGALDTSVDSLGSYRIWDDYLPVVLPPGATVIFTQVGCVLHGRAVLRSSVDNTLQTLLQQMQWFSKSTIH